MNSMNLIFNTFFPQILMIVMNYLIYRTMNCREEMQRNSQNNLRSFNGGNGNGIIRRSCENTLRRREARITRASIAITVMFVVCHAPRCIPNLMELLKYFPQVKIIKYWAAS